MSYTSSYERINWQNKPSVATPINASNLNKMDAAIKALDEAMGDVSKSNRLFSMSVQSVASNKITAYMGDTSIGEAGDLIMLNTLDKSGTTSASWSLYLIEPTPGGTSKTFALKNVDGSAAYTEAVDAGAIMFVMITGTNTANVVGVINAANIDFPLSIDKGGTGNTAGYIRTGQAENTTIGTGATAEGTDNTASGDYSHAEGKSNTSSAVYAHAEGQSTIASGQQSHVEGFGTMASKSCAHAEGANTVASGECSHAGGTYTVAAYSDQTAIGKFNDNKADTLFEVGNGTATNARSNALEVTATGHVKDGLGNDMESLSALEATASGNPIVVNAQDVAAKGLKVTLEPIQDLHGYDKPWAGGAYKNKLLTVADNIKAYNTAGAWNGDSYTLSGVTFTILKDGDGNVTGIKANGTTTTSSAISFDICRISTMTTGNYILSGCPSGGGGGTSAYYMKATSGSTNVYDEGSGVNLTVGSNNLIVTIFVGSASNKVFYPMLRLSTESDSTFAPYSNICPISGRTEVRVDDVGKNLLDITFNTVTQNGITITKLGNGEYDVHGKATANSGVYLKSNVSLKLTQDAAFVGLPSNSGLILSAYMNGEYLRVEGNTIKDVGGIGKIVNEIYLWYTNDTTYNHVRIKPMLSYDTSITYDTFEPYKSSSATIQLGQTVYGGTLDVKTGVLTIDHVSVDLGSIDYTAVTVEDGTLFYSAYNPFDNMKNTANVGEVANALCEIVPIYAQATINAGQAEGLSIGPDTCRIRVFSNSTYKDMTASEFRTAITGYKLCYELATPTTIQLTPAQLELLKGYNYITADGNIDLVYVPESISGLMEEVLVPISMLGTNESGNTKASRAYTSGEYFYKDQKMYKATTSIANGATFTVGTNCAQTTLFAELKAAQN